MTASTSVLSTPTVPTVHSPRAQRHQRRTTAVQWLRKTHGWIGLWGATLGLLFGISGIWLNHRAVLKLPPVAQQRVNSQLALPDPAPADANALGAWLQTALQTGAPPISVKVEPARPVAWAPRAAGLEAGREGRREGRPERAAGTAAPGAETIVAADARAAATPSPDPARVPLPLMQPERWTIVFGGPHSMIQAETWAGNRSVEVRTIDNGVLGTMMNLHKGVNMPVGWILLVDTLAGSLILLSLSGLALWVLTHRRRVVGYTVFAAAFATTVGLMASRL